MAKPKKRISKKDAQIKELLAENKRLKDEIRSLKYELESTDEKKIFKDHRDKSRAAFERQAENSRIFSKKRYTSFLAATIANTSVFRLYKKIVGVAKKYTLITVTLQIAAYTLAAIQTSAFFVIAASIFAVSLPFTFIFGYSALLFSFFGRRKLVKKLRQKTENKKIALFFLPKEKNVTENSFFAGNVKDWAARNGGVAFIISPYFFSSRGISRSRRGYATLREEYENIYMIRRHTYFTLKKKVLKKDTDVTVVY